MNYTDRQLEIDKLILSYGLNKIENAFEADYFIGPVKGNGYIYGEVLRLFDSYKEDLVVFNEIRPYRDGFVGDKGETWIFNYNSKDYAKFGYYTNVWNINKKNVEEHIVNVIENAIIQYKQTMEQINLDKLEKDFE